MLEGGARDPALRDAVAHSVPDPLHLAAAQASIRLGLRLGAGLRCHLSVPLRRRNVEHRCASVSIQASRTGGQAVLLGGGGGRSGGRLRRVLELLLGAEQTLENSLPEILIEGDRQDAGHDADQEELAERVALLPALALDSVGSLLEVLGSGAEIALDLLV